jgi:hypothetical protein
MSPGRASALAKIKRGAGGTAVGFGSGNKVLQELVTRFGSACAAGDPVTAIEFAHDDPPLPLGLGRPGSN